MVDVFWWKEGKLLQGAEELIAVWQEKNEGVIWIDIAGETRNREQALLTQLQCHAMAIGDVQRINHPPKVEHFDNNSFILYRNMLALDEELNISLQSVAFFIGKNYLISVHQEPFASNEVVCANKDFTRYLQSPIELMCALLRVAHNDHLERLSDVEEELSVLEEQMALHGNDSLLMQVISYRTHLRKLKRVFDYHERMFAKILRDPKLLPAYNKNSHHALQDIYDKCERLLNMTSLYYDLCGDLSDAYYSLNSYQLTRTMQVLTVITAIFIPLSFIAGLYGMNFNYMPELQWRYGYAFVLVFMACVAFGLLALFRYKKWL